MTVPDKNFVLVADLHIQPRREWGGEWYWVSLGLSAINLAIDVSAQNDHAPIIFLGDMFEHYDRHPAWLLNEVAAAIHEAADRGIEVYVLEGNHDIGSKRDTILRLIGNYPNVTVIVEPTVLEVGDLSCAFIPYLESSEETAEWVEGFCKLADVAFLHHGLEGAVTGLGYTFPEGVSSKALKEYEYVFCGHYHHHQQVFNNAWYVGSPYQQDFGERGDDMKGVWFFDYVKEALELYRIPGAPNFVDLEIEDIGEEGPTDNWWTKEDVDGNIVKMTIHGTRGELASISIATIKKQIEESGAVSVMIGTKVKQSKEKRMNVSGEFAWEKVLERHAEQEEIDDEALDVGLDILKTVKNRRAGK